MYKKIIQYCQECEVAFKNIDEDRKKQLSQLTKYISSSYKNGKVPQITVICTHNSRRSHFGQIWLAIAAEYFALPKIETYSGGTEATACHPNTVAALQRCGIEIEKDSTISETNPIYKISWAANQLGYEAFSKIYNHPPNPTKDYAAILVCTEADKGCPIVQGCSFRLALPFSDPKVADKTPKEEAIYDLRCRQIAVEMLYIMSKVNSKNL